MVRVGKGDERVENRWGCGVERVERVCEEVARWMGEARRLVVLTGAGISAGCGVPTFRESSGVWESFKPEKFGSWRGLKAASEQEPERVAAFFYEVFGAIAKARPGVAHRAVAALEGRWPGMSVITQNIDGLHLAAGSREVRQIHGSVFEVVTAKEGRWLKVLKHDELLDVVERLRRVKGGVFGGKIGGRLGLQWAVGPMLGWRGDRRLRVVMWGETLTEPDWQMAVEDVMQADVLLVIGTSGMVQPAASLPEIVRERGGRVVGIDPHPLGYEADAWLRGGADGVMARLMVCLGMDWRENRAEGAGDGGR